MVRGQAPLIVVATLACAPRAEAAPARRVDLTWRSEDATCIDQATLARTVESTLGRPVFHADAPASASIEGRVEPAASGSGFRAAMTMRSPSGEVLSQRDVSTQATSCDRLDEAVAVVIALMVDGVEETVSLRLPPEPSRTPAQAAPPPPAPAQTAPPEAGSSMNVEPEAGATIAAGLVPHAGLGAYGRLSLPAGPLSFAVGLQGFPATRTVQSGPGASIHAWTFDLDGCYAPVDDVSWRLVGCALLGAGWLAAAPFGTDRTDSVIHPLVFAGASVEGAWRVAGPLWLHLRTALTVPFESPEYFFRATDGSHTVFQPWVVSPSLSAGIGWRFGS